MSKLLESLRNAGETLGELVWLPEFGIGYYPVRDTVTVYDQKYFDNYIKYDKTDIGINMSRVELARNVVGPEDIICDVGIGCGAFVREMQPYNITYGTDINPVGVKWLKENNLIHNPVKYPVDVLTFFDSLEHIKDPTELLNSVKKLVIVSCPIYNNVEHLLKSKHFKKTEHVWYHTHSGLITFMSEFGFDFVYSDRSETNFGREDIESFVFKRKFEVPTF